MIDQWWDGTRGYQKRKEIHSFITDEDFELTLFSLNLLGTLQYILKRMYILTYARNPINSRERCWNEVENNLLKTLYFSFLHGHLWFPVHFRKCVFQSRQNVNTFVIIVASNCLCFRKDSKCILHSLLMMYRIHLRSSINFQGECQWRILVKRTTFIFIIPLL